MALVVFGVVVVIAMFLVLTGLYTVEQQTRAIVERFGKYLTTTSPGLHWKVPVFDRVAGRITHRIRELEIEVESKTKDDVLLTHSHSGFDFDDYGVYPESRLTDFTVANEMVECTLRVRVAR